MLAPTTEPNSVQPSQKPPLEYNRGTGLRMGILALVLRACWLSDFSSSTLSGGTGQRISRSDRGGNVGASAG
jgi:hypothetical protein